MFDSNTEAHWQRCVENNEPLTRQQFGRASVFYERLYNEYGFVKKQLSDFPEIMPEGSGSDDGSGASSVQQSVGSVSEHGGDAADNGSLEAGTKMGKQKPVRDESKSSGVLGNTSDCSTLEDKLERANAIRVLLSGKIIKKKGEIYDDLDEAIRGFLHAELDKIFNPPKPQGSTADFSEDEVRLLKALANTMKRKQES
jgi:hypothetical protein